MDPFALSHHKEIRAAGLSGHARRGGMDGGRERGRGVRGGEGRGKVTGAIHPKHNQTHKKQLINAFHLSAAATGDGEGEGERWIEERGRGLGTR